MPDYFQTLRMQNMFPGTQEAPANFGGGYMPTAEQYGMDMPSQGGFGGNYGGQNMMQPIENEYMPTPGMGAYGADEGYGMDFTGPMQGPETSTYDPDQRMNQLYDPQSVQSDRLNELLGSYPQRPAPLTGWRGALQKIGAVMGGANEGMGLYDEVMAPGYTNKVADWKMQAGPQQQAAQIERQSNVNDRQSAIGVISAELRNQAMQHKANNDEIRARTADFRAKAYDFKQRNPNMEIIKGTKGGNVMVRNPQTNEVFDLGIPAGTLTEADHMALGQKNALERIQETGAQGRETQDLRQLGRIELAGVTGDEARKTKETPSGTPGSTFKPEQPTQTRVRQVSKAREIMNSRPDLAKFIKIQGNDFKILAPSVPGALYGQTVGPDAAQHAEINRIIYGSPETDRRASAPPMEKTQTNRTTGAKRTLISHDGGKTWTPK